MAPATPGSARSASPPAVAVTGGHSGFLSNWRARTWISGSRAMSHFAVLRLVFLLLGAIACVPLVRTVLTLRPRGGRGHYVSFHLIEGRREEGG